MALAEHFAELVDGLPRGWKSARFDVTIEDPARVDRAALVLASATPGRSANTFHVPLRGAAEDGGASPGVVERALRRLEEEGIRARLRMASFERPERAPAPARPSADRRLPLAAQWDRLEAKLPADWSDVLAEVELDSTDFVELGALRLGPVNPYLVDDVSTFRFRVAHRFGYGAAPEMTRRCLERLDEEGISGRFRILGVLSDTRPVATQGPLWRIGGRVM
jgi:hypothetical protein